MRRINSIIKCRVSGIYETLVKCFFCLDDFNGHAERRINGYVSVRGGHGIGRRNDEGRRLLEFLMKSSYGWQRRCLKKKSRGR